MRTATATITIAIVKGAMHALLLPALIVFLVNISVDGNYGFLTGLGYLIIPTMVYARSKKKDISKKVFFGIWKVLIVGVVIYTLLIVT